jgi:dTDP-4-dehydrorhamnose reductase
MRITILGSNGQLGSDLVRELAKQHELFPLTHGDADIADLEDLRSALRTTEPDAVLNTAAFHNVPDCETSPGRAAEVNATGALHLARLAHELDYTLVHYSTDYVFDGEKQRPYVESDTARPLNVYGVTKLAGEHYVRAYAPRHFVLRVSGLYGITGCRAKGGGNFIMTMKRLAEEKPEVRVVEDEVLTPTSTEAVAAGTAGLLESQAYGLYHMTGEGSCSWYEFARAIWEELGFETPLHPTTSAEFPSPVKRPLYSVLENEGLKRLGLNGMPHWRDDLLRFLRTHMK